MKSPLYFAVSIFQTLFVSADNVLRFLQDDGDGYPTCGDCFCAPAPGQECPYDLKPETNYSVLISILRQFTWSNPMSLDCNPYYDEACDTSPPLQEGGACVVDIEPSSNTNCPTDWSYSTRTYAGSYQEALDEGLYVTHSRACGTCSSLQDLAAYMETGSSLKNKASICGFRGILNATDGVECFVGLGFTRNCANIWYDNTNFTSETCFEVCTKFTITREPSNGPLPNCTLANCLYCDEVNAGPIFKQFAGRARRNSGLLSGIVRNCSEVIPLKQENPCDGYNASTSSASGFGGYLMSALFVAVWLVGFFLLL